MDVNQQPFLAEHIPLRDLSPEDAQLSADAFVEDCMANKNHKCATTSSGFSGVRHSMIVIDLCRSQLIREQSFAAG